MFLNQNKELIEIREEAEYFLRNILARYLINSQLETEIINAALQN